MSVTDSYEFLPRPFPIAPDITLPIGGYDFDNVHVQMNLGQRRKVSGNFALDRGTFYNGHKTTISLSRGRMNAGSRLSLEPGYLLNVVDLAEGSFTSQLVGSRVTYTMTPLMFASALPQYNSRSHAVSANGGCDGSTVPAASSSSSTTKRETRSRAAFLHFAGRALIVKINRLFRP